MTSDLIESREWSILETLLRFLSLLALVFESSFKSCLSVCRCVCLSVETPLFPVEILEFGLFTASKGKLSVEMSVEVSKVCVCLSVLMELFVVMFRLDKVRFNS